MTLDPDLDAARRKAYRVVNQDDPLDTAAGIALLALTANCSPLMRVGRSAGTYPKPALEVVDV